MSRRPPRPIAALAVGLAFAACAAPAPPAPAPAPAATLPPAALTGSKTAWLFDDDTAPRLFQLEVDPADWQWLQGHATLEEYVPAAVVFEGDRFDGAAVRYKGGYGSLYACFDAQGNQTCPKLSLKVSFNELDPDGRFHGVRKLVFNACNRDPSCLRERLAYALFRAAGVPAGRAVHALVSVNGGPPSVYLLVEEVDREHLEDRWPDATGNLYKEVWPQHLSAEAYVGALQTNEEEADVQRMVALATLVAGLGPGDDAAAALAPWLDLDALARYVAVDRLTVNWDGITAWYCQGELCGNHNFFLYDDPTSGRFALIPWDLDHTFDRPDRDLGRAWWDDGPDACAVEQVNAFAGLRAAPCDPLMRVLLLDRWDAWRAELGTLTGPGAPLSEDAILTRLDRYRAMLLPHVADDPLGPGADAWRADTARLRQVIREQRREIEAFLAEDGPPVAP